MTWYQKICEKAFNKILEVPCKKQARKIIFPFNAPYETPLFLNVGFLLRLIVGMDCVLKRVFVQVRQY